MHVIHLPIFFGVASLTLAKPYHDRPRVNELTPMDVGKIDQ